MNTNDILHAGVGYTTQKHVDLQFPSILAHALKFANELKD